MASSLKPQRQGKGRLAGIRWHPLEASNILDAHLIDPSWDDTEQFLSSVQHQIEKYGCVGTHPDGDTHDDYGVPLCSHVPDSAYGEFTNVRLQRKEAVRVRKAIEEREARYEARRKELAEAHRAHLEKHPVPAPIMQPYRSHPIYAALDSPEVQEERKQDEKQQELLEHMRIHEPLSPGNARVWENYIMVREEDYKNPIFKHRAGLKEAWTGKGFVIFEREREVWWQWIL